MLCYAVPPSYQRQQLVMRLKLSPWKGAINAILEEDKRRPARQRHTAKRIFERLRAKCALSLIGRIALRRVQFSFPMAIRLTGLRKGFHVM